MYFTSQDVFLKKELLRLCPLNGPLVHFDIHAFIKERNIKELWLYFFFKHPTSMEQLFHKPQGSLYICSQLQAIVTYSEYLKRTNKILKANCSNC